MTQRDNTISQSSAQSVLATLTGLVTKCYKMAGYTFGSTQEESDMNLKDTVEILYSQLKVYFPNVTSNVLDKAFSNGALGYYGENHGMPVARFIDYLRQYYKSREGINMQTAVEEPKALPRSERADTISLLNTLYRMWKDKELIFGFPAGKLIVFMWNEGKALEYKDKDLQDEFIRQAMTSVARDKEREMQRDACSARLILDQIRSLNGDSMDVKNKAYKLVVFDFFRNCNEKGIKDMNDLFNN